MDFKRVINKETNKVTYYVDGKRVAEDVFYFREYTAQCKGMQGNSYLTTSDNRYIRHFHSFN